VVKKNKFLFLILIILIGFIIRLSFFIGNNFPLHDGGLFFVMIQDLISNKFVLPVFTTYNHANIPFIYPPLGFYVIGITEKLFGIDRLHLFRFFPLLISTLTIPALFGLAIEVLKDEKKSLIATAIFSILPTGFAWLILGGGITRSFGALFGILALSWSIRFINNGSKSSAIIGSIFCGLTVLSHPEWTWFLFYAIGLYVVLAFCEKKQKTLFRSIVIFIGTAVIILPWVITIFTYHDKSVLLPLFDGGTSKWVEIFRLILLQWSEEKFFPFVTVFSICGIFSMIKRREWFLVILLPLVFILQGRGTEQKAVIPLALLAGEGVSVIFTYLYSKFLTNFHFKKPFIIGFAFVIYIFVYLLANTFTSISGFAKPMPKQYFDSFDWINTELPADSKFLVISGKNWVQDIYSEWIPALTGKESISVVQGYEWLPGFSERVIRYDQITNEFFRGTEYLFKLINNNNMHPDYLILLNEDQASTSDGESIIPIHWKDALAFPGVKMVYKTGSVLILDIRTVIN